MANVVQTEGSTAEHWVRPPVVVEESPDLNPPPTEGLLWPRFDHLLPADE